MRGVEPFRKALDAQIQGLPEEKQRALVGAATLLAATAKSGGLAINPDKIASEARQVVDNATDEELADLASALDES